MSAQRWYDGVLDLAANQASDFANHHHQMKETIIVREAQKTKFDELDGAVAKTVLLLMAVGDVPEAARNKVARRVGKIEGGEQTRNAVRTVLSLYED